MWYRLVAGVNAQLRTVRKGSKSTTLMPVIMWLETHANPWLFNHNVRVDLAWCQSTASGYYQLGLVLNSSDEVPQYFQPSDMLTLPRSPGRYVCPFEWLLLLINPLQLVFVNTRLVRDDQQVQIETVAIFLIIFGTRMNIFLLVKVNILFLLEWYYRCPD